MSRDVEVLRALLAHIQDGHHAGPDSLHSRATIDSLRAAILALEEKEAPREPCIRCGRPNVVGEHAAWCHASDEGAAPKSSSDSMEERIQELSAALQHCHNLAHIAMTKGGLEEALENIEITTRDSLHLHQSWCRGDHSEGACPAPDSMEVDRGE